VKKYRALKEQIEEEFGDDVKVTCTEDPCTTGNFEVTIVESGKLIHSKSTRGQGKCETAEQVQLVIDQIQEYLDQE